MSDILDRLREYADSRLYALPGHHYVCDVPEILNEHAALVTRLITAERERDEARKCLASVTADRTYYERQVKAGVVRYQPHDGETKAAYGRIYELERERDEARREREDYKAMYLDLLDAAKRHETEREALRQRAERAEAVAAYIRRAFRGAVESDALAVTYKTVGSYRAGLLKTINALDAAEAP